MMHRLIVAAASIFGACSAPRARRLVAGMLVAAALLPGCQGNEDDALSVVISLPDERVAGAARGTLLVDYSSSGARILSEDGGPACAFILPGVTGQFGDDHKGTLTIHATGARALHGPADFVACRMKAGPDATAEGIRAKLDVKISAAEDTSGKAVDLAARPAKARGGAGGGPGAPPTESEIQAAQDKAVKDAEIIASTAPAPPPPAPEGAPANPTGAPPAANSPPGGPAPPPSAASPPVAPATPKTAGGAPAVAARPVTSNTPAPPSGPNDQGAVPVNQDKDPTYDDSPSDDPRVPAYNIDIAVASHATFGALQIEISHLGNSGGFIGHNDKVECVSLVNDVIVAANGPGERVAKIGMISLQGVRSPAVILRCGFRTREAVSPAAFAVEVADASDTSSEPLDPIPTVVVQSVSRR